MFRSIPVRFESIFTDILTAYEFLTPSNKLIRKTIIPFLFEVKEVGNPLPKEERIISVQWMDKEEFIDKCTHENVKLVVKNLL